MGGVQIMPKIVTGIATQYCLPVIILYFALLEMVYIKKEEAYEGLLILFTIVFIFWTVNNFTLQMIFWPMFKNSSSYLQILRRF